MKFLLKDELIHIVGNHGLANNKVEGSVEAPGLDGFSLSYSINNKNYKSLSDKIIIHEGDLKGTSIQLTVRATKGDKIKYFKSDVIPLTHAIILGKKLEDSYPEALKFLLKEIDKLKGTMLDIVDTFEEITKKGSLF
jgi:hypothetical protein